MPTITYKKRTGKDFFEFMERSLTDENLATIWAIERFVLVDGEHLETDAIFSISDKYFMMLSAQVFSTQTSDSVTTDDDGNVIYRSDDNLITIKAKEIKRNILTKLQANASKKNASKVEVLKKTIPIFYEVSLEEINELPYQIVAEVINRINFFLLELSQPRNSIEVENDAFFKAPKKAVSE